MTSKNETRINEILEGLKLLTNDAILGCRYIKHDLAQNSFYSAYVGASSALEDGKEIMKLHSELWDLEGEDMSEDHFEIFCEAESAWMKSRHIYQIAKKAYLQYQA